MPYYLAEQFSIFPDRMKVYNQDVLLIIPRSRMTSGNVSLNIYIIFVVIFIKRYCLPQND